MKWNLKIGLVHARVHASVHVSMRPWPPHSPITTHTINLVLRIMLRQVPGVYRSFINLEKNPISEMIIDIAKNYPEINVENTLWYKLNNEITDKI